MGEAIVKLTLRIGEGDVDLLKLEVFLILNNRIVAEVVSVLSCRVGTSFLGEGFWWNKRGRW